MTPFDVFNNDAFSAVSMSRAIDKIDYVPGLLGQIPGLFVPEPISTEVVWIEQRSLGATILQTTPRGTPPKSEGPDKRTARAFKTVRIADSSRITASELLAIRGFGSDVSVKTAQEEVARRQQKIMMNMDITMENLRMGAILGKTVDADGSTIYDWAAEFGLSIPGEVDFDLDNGTPAEGALRKKCNAVWRSVRVAMKGRPFSGIVAICGDAFWDDLTAHPEVIKTYINWQAAADLRNGFSTPWSNGFRYGDITWINYRGTDDGTTLTVNTDKAKFFPVGSDIFRWVMSPGERFDHLGTVGQNFYSNMVMDDDRNSWVDIEVYSYPLPVCVAPDALYQAKRT